MVSISPPDWGSDKLSQFIQTALDNTYATFHNKKNYYKDLSEIDSLFLTIAMNLSNPKDALSPLMLLRSHSAYRAACIASMSGQAVEVFALLRLCLEFAGYAILTNNNSLLGELWLNRHVDDDSRKAVIKKFQIKEVREAIENKDKKLADVFQTLYDRAIDFGAHPNERAVTGNLKIEETDSEANYIQIYLHNDSLALDHALRSTAQTGICSLYLFQNIFPERFILLGIREKLQKLKSRNL